MGRDNCPLSTNQGCVKVVTLYPNPPAPSPLRGRGDKEVIGEQGGASATLFPQTPSWKVLRRLCHSRDPPMETFLTCGRSRREGSNEVRRLCNGRRLQAGASLCQCQASGLRGRVPCPGLYRGPAGRCRR